MRVFVCISHDVPVRLSLDKLLCLAQNCAYVSKLIHAHGFKKKIHEKAGNTTSENRYLTEIS